MALNPRRTALLICDVQERFRGAIHQFDAVATTINRMLKAAALKVITTEQNPKALGHTISELQTTINALPAHLNLGTYEKSKFSMLTPEVCKVLGGRFATLADPNAKVDPEGIERIIVVGIESHVCVLQTSLEAARLSAKDGGPAPIVIADAVSSVNAPEVPIALARLRAAGVDVGSSESVLFQLMGDAGQPNFREFQRLIKGEIDNTKASLKALL
ncbi:Isochorismatase domain-containing protein 2 [Vanrija pseudolonga]|uniref:Isochorismatase domain-containing protein 2 n=1 Tax=Vanrija pseudolonga TaxID=143232 RepID=A0AAF1BMP7_9TREE|nr:Isochorismatase domain-containing protein 2 [Vanrija pseudolonga]